MKKLLLIFTLLFSTLMFSSTSFAGWTKVVTTDSGHSFYVDFERIRKHDGYVYFWRVRDYIEPDQWGDLSSKLYNQGDCKLFRYKILSASYHKEPMGGGTGDVQEPVKKGWKYPSPNSAKELILQRVCSQ